MSDSSIAAVGDSEQGRLGTGQFSAHAEAVVRVARAWSRTVATGIVDTTTSAVKAAALADAARADHEPIGLDVGSADPAEAFADSVRAGCAVLDPLTFKDVDPSMLLRLNKTVAGSALGGHERTYDKAEFGYIPCAEIPTNMAAFCARLQSWPTADVARDRVVDLLFDVHWSVDLRGHYFLDGCGRTALILGCWVTATLSGGLLDMPARADYLQVALHQEPRTEWRRLWSGRPEAD